MIHEKHKEQFKQPGWTRVAISFSTLRTPPVKQIAEWVKTEYPESRYYYSYHASAYWIESPVAVTEMVLRFGQYFKSVKTIEANA